MLIGNIENVLHSVDLLGLILVAFSISLLFIIIRFSKSEKYIIPSIGNVEFYEEYINSLPLLDDPEVFGMHENANITYQA